MIIFLTGPTGSGKTDTSWELLKHFDQMVFLDCDWFASMQPFSWEKESDVAMVYQALADMVKFHEKKSNTNVVITLTLEMARLFEKYKSYFEEFDMPLFVFRLHVSDQEGQRRIFARDRIDSQKQEELKNFKIQQQAFDSLCAHNKLFIKIEATTMTEEQVAQKIKEIIGPVRR